MSFDLGKKIVMIGFFVGAVASAVSNFIYQKIFNDYNLLQHSGMFDILNTLSMVGTFLALVVIGGFVMMWLTGGNILDLGIAGSMALSMIVSYIMPRFGMDIYGNPVITLITTVLDCAPMLIWAFKYLSRNIMICVLLGGVLAVQVLGSIIFSAIAPGIYYIAMGVIALGCGAVKAYAAYCESED